MKIGLGTVQFGMDYGISNIEGKCNVEEVTKILSVAADLGIKVIDTAALYGTSEESLGKVIPPGHAFDIVTKTPKFGKAKITSYDANILEDVFKDSLKKTCQPLLYGLLIHHAEDLLSEGGHRLMAKMKELKEKGLVNKIGVSVYDGKQIDSIMERYSIDLIQLPLNVLDQRLVKSGHLSYLKGAGVEIHVRSVFLQGLLLMEPETLPPYFDSVRKHLNNYHQITREYGLSAVQASLSFALGMEEVDIVICGVNNYKQLMEICSSVEKTVDKCMLSDFAVDDISILNPSLWRV